MVPFGMHYILLISSFCWELFDFGRTCSFDRWHVISIRMV